MALIWGNNFANLLFGTNSLDTILGFDGNDTLVGGAGGDLLDGGTGIDTANYATSAAAVQVDLLGVNTGGAAQGDILVSIENVTGSIFGDRIKGNGGGNVLTGLGGNDTLEGRGGDDTLLGGNGNDHLDGGAGDDSMNGGANNDTYVIGSAGDRVNELGGSGIDTVLASRSTDLSSAQFSGNVENLTLIGTAGLDATGNGLNNTIRGNSGDNEIDGGTGSDTMIGGAGDDTYVVNSGGDVVDEGAAGSGGIDLVISDVTFNLRGAQVAGTQNEVENLDLRGNAAINGFGNELDNRISGNAAANTLIGFGGNDVLFGGGGADTFVFRSALNANANVDEVLDFNVVRDTIQLENLFMQSLGAGALDPDAFRIGVAAADAEDRIIYNANNGNLSYDADGVGGAAATRFAILDAGLALASANFDVI
jgi:Ca2+-binding RTX toxin-like protein